MISKIKLKTHVLGNKSLFLSIFLSLSLSLVLSLYLLRLLSLSLVNTGVMIRHWILLGHMRSTGGLVPAGLGVVRVYGCGKVVLNHPNSPVTWSSVPVQVSYDHQNGSVFKTTVRGSWGLCMDLRKPYGPRTSSYGYSQANNASARARTVPTPRILTIPKSTDNPQNARMTPGAPVDSIRAWGHP